MSRPMYSPAARRDLNQILDYISQHSRRNALRLIDRLLTKCELLAESPEMGDPCVVGNFDGRVWPAGNYLLFYRAGQHRSGSGVARRTGLGSIVG